MPRFDPHNPRLLPLAQAERLIGDGWLLQYRGRGLISRLIQYGTGGVHSHSAMTRRTARSPRGVVSVMEMREFVGGRVKPLEWHARRWPGQIDVFAPDAGARWPEWRSRRTADEMLNLTQMRYGYLGVCRLALQRVPVLWRLWPLSMDDARPYGAPFCSQAVCTATRLGGVDACPRLPDDRVTPNHLTWSMFYSYQFTLTV